MAVEKTSAAADTAADDKRKNDVAEYLQAPRRKRRSYVLVACGKGIPAEVQGGIDQFLKVNSKNVAISHPRTPDELMKQFSRQIVLLVFDDEFCDLDEGMRMVAELKRKKNSAVVPVLFLTRQPERLIESYNKLLLPYQEGDEYVNYSKVPVSHVFSKVRAGLSNKNRRRSRRYKVDVPISYYVLEKDAYFEGRLTDLSLHGAMIRSEDNRIFGEGEQVKLHLPVEGVFKQNEGDFLKMSARVRRVFISGNQAGVSFEHVNESQLVKLTTYLTDLVNTQNTRKAAAMRARQR